MIYKVYVYVNHETGADTAFFTDFEMAKNDSTLHLLQKIYSFMGLILGNRIHTKLSQIETVISFIIQYSKEKDMVIF